MSSSKDTSSKFKNNKIDRNMSDNKFNETEKDRYIRNKTTDFINKLIRLMLVILIVITASFISAIVIIGQNSNLGILKLFAFQT